MGHLLDPATRQPVHLAATTLVGRGPAADWTIPSRLVSTEHARIAWRQGGWSLKDLGSRNGTFVDGQRLGAGQTTWLQPGMQLSFGADRPCFEVVGIACDQPPPHQPQEPGRRSWIDGLHLELDAGQVPPESVGLFDGFGHGLQQG